MLFPPGGPALIASVRARSGGAKQLSDPWKAYPP
jgi:hypothetical protein